VGEFVGRKPFSTALVAAESIVAPVRKSDILCGWPEGGGGLSSVTWADPVAALAIVGFAVHEGKEALQHSREED